jgi:hypothetical protein
MRLSNVCFLSCVLAIPMFANAADSNVPGNDWLLVPGSHDRDFKVICIGGNKEVWGIYPRPGVSDYQVARDVIFRQLPNGQTQLSLMRGFTVANKATTYLPAAGVSCEITEK